MILMLSGVSGVTNALSRSTGGRKLKIALVTENLLCVLGEVVVMANLSSVGKVTGFAFDESELPADQQR